MLILIEWRSYLQIFLCLLQLFAHLVNLLSTLLKLSYPFFLLQTNKLVWKDRDFARWAKARWLERQRRQFICKHNSTMTSLSPSLPNLFWRSSTKMMHLVAGCVMEGSVVFCQKNILEHSMRFHRLFKEMFTNTRGLSDIVAHRTYIWNTE